MPVPAFDGDSPLGIDMKLKCFWKERKLLQKFNASEDQDRVPSSVWASRGTLQNHSMVECVGGLDTRVISKNATKNTPMRVILELFGDVDGQGDLLHVVLFGKSFKHVARNSSIVADPLSEQVENGHIGGAEGD